MITLLKVGWILAFLCALAGALGMAVASNQAVEAWEIMPHAKEIVKIDRDPVTGSVPDKGDPKRARKVMELYGNPGPEPIRWVFVPREKFFHPEEMPELTLLPVDRNKAESPLQLQTVTWLGLRFSGAAAVVGFLLWGIWFFLKRRRTASQNAPATL